VKAPSTEAHSRAAAAALEGILSDARSSWQWTKDRAAAQVVPWRCAACGRDTHAPSIADLTCCLRCVPPRCRMDRYAWRAAPFGRIRHVPAWHAARWEADDDR